MLFIAGQYPQINDLKDAIMKFEGLDLDLQEIELVKYSPHEFEWLYISQEYIESENEKKKTGKKRNGKKGIHPDIPITMLTALNVIGNQQAPEKLSLKSAPYFLKDGGSSLLSIKYKC